MAATRNLIVCSDGTWNSPYTRDRGVYATSNVLKMVKALQHGPVPAGEVEQHVFYDEGVGTGGWLDRLVGGATGAGLEQNVLDCYRFLVDNYQERDKIFLLGFSRGAYTVRRLAGFICRFGLLRRNKSEAAESIGSQSQEQVLTDAIRNLYAQFQQLRPGQKPPSIDKERLYPDIEAIGVWDTVGAMGLPDHWLLTFLLGFRRKKYQFIDDRLSPKVHYAYHALAMDEPRKIFAPALWKEDGHHPNLKQVWFSGSHSNVGGGYQEAGLSDVTLQWMIEQLQKCGLRFRDDYTTRAILPDYYGEIRNPRSGLWPKLLYQAWTRPINNGSIIHPSVRTRYVPPSLYRIEPEYLKRLNGFNIFGADSEAGPQVIEPGLSTNAQATNDNALL